METTLDPRPDGLLIRIRINYPKSDPKSMDNRRAILDY